MLDEDPGTATRSGNRLLTQRVGIDQHPCFLTMAGKAAGQQSLNQRRSAQFSVAGGIGSTDDGENSSDYALSGISPSWRVAPRVTECGRVT